MAQHYLTEFVKSMEAQVKIQKGDFGDVMYRGACGSSKLVRNGSGKYAVYFFELGALKADEKIEYSKLVEAKMQALEWATKGRI